MPATPFAHPRRQTAFRMGVFDDRGRIVRGSLLQRSYGQVGFAADLLSASRSDQRSVVFAGHLSYHFGHFILESLSRLWYASQHPERPIVWACRPELDPPAWHGWQRQILDVLGIRNEVLLLTEPTRFQSVDVPQPGYRVKDFFARQHANFLAAYPARARRSDLRVWLSRSARLRVPQPPCRSAGAAAVSARLDGGAAGEKRCPSASSSSSWRPHDGWPVSRVRRSTCSCSWVTSVAWRWTSSVVTPVGRSRSRTRTTGSSPRCGACASGCT